MEWRGQRQSSNVIDSRGGGGGFAVGGGIGGVILTLLYYLLGGTGSATTPQAPTSSNGPYYTNNRSVESTGPAKQDTMKQFVSAVLGSTEDVWTQIFAKNGRRYVDPHLVLFTNRIQSGCGSASMAMGPFYCPEDQDVYIDLGF